MSPEQIADAVLAARYGSADTFGFAVDADPAGLDAIAIQAMLKEAAAMGINTASCDVCGYDPEAGA